MANQFGSFGAATGSTDSIKAALQRRNLGGSVGQLDQISAGAPGSPDVSPSTIPSTAGGGGASPTATEQRPTIPEDEKIIISKGLVKRLDQLGKIDLASSAPPTAPIGA